MLRNILILTLGIALPFTLGVACNDDDDNGDDRSDDGGDDDDGDDDDGNDDGGNDDGGNDDGGNDDGGNDDGGEPECEGPADCDIIHCNCESGVVNYSACNYGKCGTQDDCAGVCQDADMPSDEGGEEEGGDTDW